MCTGVVGTRSRGVCWDFFQQDSSTEMNTLLIKLLIRIGWWTEELHHWKCACAVCTINVGSGKICNSYENNPQNKQQNWTRAAAIRRRQRLFQL